jgi:hypothetical protein
MTWEYEINGVGPLVKKATDGELTPQEMLNELGKLLEHKVPMHLQEFSDIAPLIERAKNFRPFDGEEPRDVEARANLVLEDLYDWADENRVFIVPYGWRNWE